MSKQEDIDYVKMNFTAFGEDMLAKFKRQYDAKGMSFTNISMERMCTKLTEEVGEVAETIFKDMGKEAMLSEITDVANVLLMMYIKVKEEQK